MAYLNANIPTTYAQIRREYLYDLKKHHGEVEDCIIFGLTSLGGRAILFHAIMGNGAIFYRLPISAFIQTGFRPESVPTRRLDELELWNCFSYYPTVTHWSILSAASGYYFGKDKKKHHGRYLFTVDWGHPDVNMLDTDHSEIPQEHKCAHIIALDDGNFAAQPNNRCIWDLPSFTVKNNIPDWKVQTNEWNVEDSGKWKTQDTDNFFYEIEEKKMKQEIIDKLPPDVQKEYMKMAIKLSEKEKQVKVQDDFLTFVKHVWPEFIEGKHHKKIADKFNKLAKGEIKRLIINMPPRHTKSEFASFLLPAWMVGRKPDLKIIQSTHTTELAIRFGRKAKTLIDSPEYQQMFKTTLREDSQAAGKWETSQGGEYYAAGVGSAITGRGADLLIIDDPHSEQDALNMASMERAYEWYTSGPRQRLQPGGAIVVVMTRWNMKDLTGMLLKSQKELKADKWEIIEFPAILPSGKPVWPEYWKKDELEGVKASISIGKWNAQWMQNPTAEEGSLIKREWWKVWEKDTMPPLEHVIQSYDTAFLKKESADYSAITTWGVFRPDQDSPPNLILLDAVKERLEFPDLRKKAMEQYRYWNPETVIIESKASGLPLTYELRKMGIPVINFTPSRGNDKHARVNACAPIFESGQIWAPDMKFAEEVVEECASFPYGDHDDLVDSTTQAVMRFRQGGFISLPDDEKEDSIPSPIREYY